MARKQTKLKRRNKINRKTRINRRKMRGGLFGTKLTEQNFNPPVKAVRYMRSLANGINHQIYQIRYFTDGNAKYSHHKGLQIDLIEPYEIVISAARGFMVSNIKKILIEMKSLVDFNIDDDSISETYKKKITEFREKIDYYINKDDEDIPTGLGFNDNVENKKNFLYNVIREVQLNIYDTTDKDAIYTINKIRENIISKNLEFTISNTYS